MNILSDLRIIQEPPGSTHFQRIVDRAGKVRGWVEIPKPVRDLDRALRAAARNLHEMIELPTDVLSLGWKRGRLTKGEREFLLTALIDALGRWEDAHAR